MTRPRLDEMDDLAARVVDENHSLARDAALGVPKTWGTLAAKGVLALRARLGRAPTETERRTLWAAIWRHLPRD